uniref:BED-type domain-containing protein n=1 Tax=Ditylenchus dipsaci TaxID=166011 RepID=A0A915DY72_9BILA
MFQRGPGHPTNIPAASQPDKNKVIETYSTPSKASPCKKMSIKLDKHEPEWSCWHYYKRQRKPSIATCRLCGWSIGIGAGLSDLLLADHMQNAHPHQHSNRLQAEALQRLRQLTAQMVAPTFSVAVDRELQCLSIEVDNLSNELVQIPLQLPSYATTNNNDHLPLDESIVCCQLDNLLNELQIPKCRVRFSETKQ